MAEPVDPGAAYFSLMHNHDISELTLLATCALCCDLQVPRPLLSPSAQTANILSSVRHRIAMMNP
jgi:hypothetical protein